MKIITNLKLTHKIFFMHSVIFVFSVGIITLINSHEASHSITDLNKSKLSQLVILAKNTCKLSIPNLSILDFEQKKTRLNTAFQNIKIGETGYIYTMDSKGVLQVHPNKSGEDISNYNFTQEIMMKAPLLKNDEVGWIKYKWERDGILEEKIVAYTYLPELDWVITASSYLDELSKPINRIKKVSLIIGFLCIITSLCLAYFLSRIVINPILGLSKTVNIITRKELATQAKLSLRSKTQIR